MKTVFITGNDTGVGKTHVGSMLVKALNKNGLDCMPGKPVESGCRLVGGACLPEDALSYFKACAEKYSLDEICPYRYQPPISPERAMRLAKQTVSIKDLVKACQTDTKKDILFIEGAGGFYSPLCSDGLNADLAQKLKSDLILVIKDRLGCINQALLSIAAIESRKLNLLALVLNQHRRHEESSMDNLEDLQMRLATPVIAMPSMIDAGQESLNRQFNAIQQLLDIIKASLHKSM